jgi:hypothetical protein
MQQTFPQHAEPSREKEQPSAAALLGESPEGLAEGRKKAILVRDGLVVSAVGYA